MKSYSEMFQNLRWRNENAKFNLTRMKLGIMGFFGSLISNQESNFENSKWPIQYGGLKLQNSI